MSELTVGDGINAAKESAVEVVDFVSTGVSSTVDGIAGLPLYMLGFLGILILVSIILGSFENN